MTTDPTDDELRDIAQKAAITYFNTERNAWRFSGETNARHRALFNAGVAAGRESVAPEPATGFWECGRCGGSAWQHTLSDSTCVWEPVWHSTVAPRIIREELAKLLVDEGLAEAERGYGHATGEQVAAFVLSALGMTEEGQ
jgi:hypothetical protein